jgi:hypothetical protein
MVSAREASYAIYGAYRLARFDASGVQFFDDTPEAFWNSFWAAAVVLPGYALLLLMRLADAPVPAGAGTVLLVEAIAYVAGWFAYPLAVFHIARAFDRLRVYRRYIVAYNWAVVLQIALLLAVTALDSSGALPRPFGAIVSLAGTMAILAYQWFIARAAFAATIGGALALVALDLSLGIVIDGAASHILTLGAGQAG